MAGQNRPITAFKLEAAPAGYQTLHKRTTINNTHCVPHAQLLLLSHLRDSCMRSLIISFVALEKNTTVTTRVYSSWRSFHRLLLLHCLDRARAGVPILFPYHLFHRANTPQPTTVQVHLPICMSQNMDEHLNYLTTKIEIASALGCEPLPAFAEHAKKRFLPKKSPRFL
ncbi:unnamed protein product [Laminaria digitata]